MESLASLIAKEYGGRLDERGNRWLRMMEQNGQDLIARVHDILEVSRVGARPEAVEAVDPALVLQEVLKARAGEIESAGAHVEAAPAMPLVACHRAYLSQIFDNLISNAIKFSAGGERVPVLRIAAARQGDRILFSVSDNGPGIPDQSRERVFEPFVRLNPETARGSGIGLSIVRRIVELYGGKAWIEPNEPAGCRVVVSLPALGDLVRASGPSLVSERST
jgi:signal transduction histidine kinase